LALSTFRSKVPKGKRLVQPATQEGQEGLGNDEDIPRLSYGRAGEGREVRGEEGLEDLYTILVRIPPTKSGPTTVQPPPPLPSQRHGLHSQMVTQHYVACGRGRFRSLRSPLTYIPALNIPPTNSQATSSASSSSLE